MKKFFAIILSLVIAASLAGCNTQPKMGAGNKVIATSGSEKMYLRDYLYTLGSYKAQNESYINQVMGLTAEEFDAYWNEESYISPGFTMFDDMKDTALESAKEMATLYKLAKDNGFTHDEAEITELKANLANAVASLNSPEKTGERYFYEYYYVTIEEACEVSKMISTVEQYENSIYDSIVVSDGDVKAFFDDPANVSAIDSIQEALVAHVLVQFPEAPVAPVETDFADKAQYDAAVVEYDAAKAEYDATLEAKKEECFAKAEDILARAQSGEDFGQLAAEFSDDGGSSNNNGEYTITRSTSFVTEFLDWTFDANVGDFGIIQTSYGYHVMYLKSLQGYEDMKETLRESVIQQKYADAVDAVIAANAMEWNVDQDMLINVKYSVYGETPAAK